jgi:transposase-like protein
MNAYSHDLREKIVQASSERGMGKSEAARTFGVSLSSVKRYARAASDGRSLAPKKHLEVPRNRRKNTTLIASMSTGGMGECLAVEGAITKVLFEAYVERVLTPSARW